MSTVPAPPPTSLGFRHEAAMYAGLDDFVPAMSAFVRDGLRAEEPVLVVVGDRKIRALREELGSDAGDVLFADMADVGANPARIIPAWREFVDERRRPGRGLRGIGEPIYSERGPAELVECHRHESLLNLAFADTASFWLLCPYDTESLAPDVIETARRTHPVVSARSSAQFDGLEAVAAPFSEPLPEPPTGADALDVTLGTLGAVRRFVRDRAAAAGLRGERVRDLLVAVSEIATNSIRHGGGRGRLLVWGEPGALVCEVRDEGRIVDPLVGRERPEPGQPGGYGMWLANQLCDLVQVRAFGSSGAVRLHMRLD